MLLSVWLSAGAQEQANPDDVPAQVDALFSVADTSGPQRAIYDATRQWAETDPIAAYRAVMKQPSGGVRDAVEGALLISWMGIDTVAALRFVAELEEPPAYLMSASTMQGAIPGWLPVDHVSDPLEILGIAAGLPEAIARSVRLQITRRMARTDPSKAAELIKSFPPVDRRQAGMVS